jgi:nitrile hydratase
VNGPQDLGGQMGFGPVAPEPDEPVFHADWEKRALGLTLAAGAMGAWTIDESRHARESLHPADYYASSYYAIWITALERLLVRHGFVTEAELAGAPAAPGARPKRVLAAAEVPAVIARGGPCDRDPAGRPPAFAAGDAVRTRVMHPKDHTRLPRYARGKRGRIEAVQGFFVLPDSSAHGRGEAPEWVYTVVFEAPELWGRDADPASRVSIDAWESYLEPA